MRPAPSVCKCARSFIVASAAAWLSFAGRAPGQSVWDGAKGSPNWQDVPNWVGGNRPTTGSDVAFAAASATEVATNNNMGPMALNSLTVNGANSVADWSISGSALVVPNVDVASGKSLTMLASLGTVVDRVGTLTKSGGGTLVLSGPSYANSTVLSGGTLLVNALLTGSSAGAVTIQTGTTLGGTGLITIAPTTVQGGGTVAPGDAANPVSELTLDQTTFDVGGTYAVDVGSFSDVSTRDLLSLAGPLTLAPGSVVSVTNLAGTTPTDQTARNYTIATASSINGASTGTEDLGQYTVGGGNTGPVQISASGFAAGDRFSLQRQGTSLVLTYTPVPEPVAVLAVFAAAVAAWHWRRTRTARHAPVA
jgi:autotransporter-associated beta strand protein